MQRILYIQEKLYDHGLVGAKQVRVLLIDCLDAGRIGHALGKMRNNACDRISGHQARQGEIQNEGKNERDQEPGQLVKEVLSVAFQRNTSS